MRASEIFREAWRNVAGGAARAGWLTSAFVLLIGLLSLAELATVSGLDLRARQYHDAGASIRILKVERAVDAHRCDMLPVTDGIVSAGALRSMAPLGISSLRGLTARSLRYLVDFRPSSVWMMPWSQARLFPNPLPNAGTSGPVTPWQLIKAPCESPPSFLIRTTMGGTRGWRMQYFCRPWANPISMNVGPTCGHRLLASIP